MNLTTLRERLMEQHRQLRIHIDEVLAVRTDDRRAEIDIRIKLAAISDELARHNREEETLLAAVVPTVDAWGKIRKQLMDDHHARQHQAQFDALRSVVDGHSSDGGIVAGLELARRCLREILSHMEKEEQEILHPDVLRDDAYAIDPEAE